MAGCGYPCRGVHRHGLRRVERLDHHHDGHGHRNDTGSTGTQTGTTLPSGSTTEAPGTTPDRLADRCGPGPVCDDFATPSGNIICFASGGQHGFVECEIKSGLVPPPPRDGCDLDQPGLSLPSTGLPNRAAGRTPPRLVRQADTAPGIRNDLGRFRRSCRPSRRDSAARTATATGSSSRVRTGRRSELAEPIEPSAHIVDPPLSSDPSRASWRSSSYVPAARRRLVEHRVELRRVHPRHLVVNPLLAEPLRDIEDRHHRDSSAMRSTPA